jgi:hypothetical protein
MKWWYAAHIAAQLYGVPQGLLEVFNTILYENEFSKSSSFSPAPKVFSGAFHFNSSASQSFVWFTRL